MAGMAGVGIRAAVAATQAVVDMEAGRCMWLVGVDIRAAVAATQAVVDMEAGRCMWLAGADMQAVAATAAVHRTWLAVGIGVAVDMEAVRTLTPADKP
jgi:hypothetical protein